MKRSDFLKCLLERDEWSKEKQVEDSRYQDRSGTMCKRILTPKIDCVLDNLYFGETRCVAFIHGLGEWKDAEELVSKLVEEYKQQRRDMTLHRGKFGF